MLGNGQVRFGGRVGETDRRQRRHRAPARPDPSLMLHTLVFSSASRSPTVEMTAATSTFSASA